MTSFKNCTSCYLINLQLAYFAPFKLNPTSLVWICNGTTVQIPRLNCAATGTYWAVRSDGVGRCKNDPHLLRKISWFTTHLPKPLLLQVSIYTIHGFIGDNLITLGGTNVMPTSHGTSRETVFLLNLAIPGPISVFLYFSRNFNSRLWTYAGFKLVSM